MRVPILEWSRQYQRAWFRFDLVAGLTVANRVAAELVDREP